MKIETNKLNVFNPFNGPLENYKIILATDKDVPNIRILVNQAYKQLADMV